MPGRVLAKNTLALVVSRTFFVVFSLLLIRIITENFGRDGYGAYGFVTALVLFFANFADWGTQIIAVREISREGKLQERVFHTALTSRLILSIFAFVLVNLIVRIYSPWHEYVQFITIASFVLFFLSLQTSVAILFQAVLRADKIALIATLGVIAFFVFVLLFLGFGLSGVFAAWVLGAAVAAIISLVMSKSTVSLRLNIDTGILKKLIREALPMGTLLLVFSIYNRVDIIILEHYKGLGDVAIYNLAYKIHENLILGASFLMATLFPVLSRAFAEKRAVGDLYKKSLGIIGLLGLLAGVAFFILAPLAVSIMTGSQYEEFQGSILALRILVFATIVSYLNHLSGFALVAFGRQRASLLIGVVALIGNVLLNVFLIPLYSYTAAAAITVITEVFIFSASSFVVWRMIGVLPNPAYFLGALKHLIHGKIF